MAQYYKKAFSPDTRAICLYRAHQLCHSYIAPVTIKADITSLSVPPLPLLREKKWVRGFFQSAEWFPVNSLLGVPLRFARGRAASETVAKIRESTTLPLCHATHGHSRMSGEGVLQQSPSGFTHASSRLTERDETRPSGGLPHPSRKAPYPNPLFGGELDSSFSESDALLPSMSDIIPTCAVAFLNITPDPILSVSIEREEELRHTTLHKQALSGLLA